MPITSFPWLVKIFPSKQRHRLFLFCDWSDFYTQRTCQSQSVRTVSFDWFLSTLDWILNFYLLKLLIFYRKLLWNFRSRLNYSKLWVFEPVFEYVWSKSSFFVDKAYIWYSIIISGKKSKVLVCEQNSKSTIHSKEINQNWQCAFVLIEG